MDHETVWRDAVFEPGRSEYFFLPVEGGAPAERFKTPADAGKVLTATLSYGDRKGRKMPGVTATTDFKAVVQNWDNARWQIRDSEMYELTKAIEKGLDKGRKECGEGHVSVETEGALEAVNVMDEWTNKMRPRPARVPQLAYVGTVFRVVGHSRRLMRCAVYRVAIVHELRLEYEHDDDLVRSQLFGALAKMESPSWRVSGSQRCSRRASRNFRSVAVRVA